MAQCVDVTDQGMLSETCSLLICGKIAASENFTLSVTRR